MRKYEYEVIVSKPEALQNALTDLGKQGWKFVHLIVLYNTVQKLGQLHPVNEMAFELIFEREIIEIKN